jgi:predicted nuclease with TOPRIM domain
MATLAASGVSGAEPPDTLDWDALGESKAYCDYVTALSEGERAVLLAPELFSLTSTVATDETGSQYLGSDVGLRQSVGLRLRTSRLRRARALGSRNEAECQRYRARAQLARVLELAADVGIREGIGAEIAALAAGLTQAETLVEGLRKQVGARAATQQELLSAELKLEQLRTRVDGAQQRRDRLREVPAGLPSEITELVVRFREADERIAEAEADLREASSWEFDLRGGYDQIIGDSREIPAFAALTVSVSLGSLHQRSAHARGLRRRADWRQREFGGLRREVTKLLQELEAARAHAENRLERVRSLRDDLSRRISEVASLTGEYARRHRDAMWFEWVVVDSEAAHLEARLPRLDAFLIAATGAH